MNSENRSHKPGQVSEKALALAAELETLAKKCIELGIQPREAGKMLRHTIMAKLYEANGNNFLRAARQAGMHRNTFMRERNFFAPPGVPRKRVNGNAHAC